MFGLTGGVTVGVVAGIGGANLAGVLIGGGAGFFGGGLLGLFVCDPPKENPRQLKQPQAPEIPRGDWGNPYPPGGANQNNKNWCRA